MKAASGELSLTVITIIAIGAVMAFFWLFWPKIQDAITGQWDNITDTSNDTTKSQLGMNQKTNSFMINDYQVTL